MSNGEVDTMGLQMSQESKGSLYELLIPTEGGDLPLLKWRPQYMADL